MSDQYKLNPKDYQVEKATITRARVEDVYNTQYIALQLQCMSGKTVEYPAISLSNLNAGVESLLQTLDVDSLPQVLQRTVYVVRDSKQREDVFLLFNPDNNQFFSLQAQFFPQCYDDALKQMLQDKPEINISSLDKTEGLLVSVVMSLSPDNEYCQKMQKVVSTHLLYKNLVEKTEFKYNVSNETIIKKKI